MRVTIDTLPIVSTRQLVNLSTNSSPLSDDTISVNAEDGFVLSEHCWSVKDLVNSQQIVSHCEPAALESFSTIERDPTLSVERRNRILPQNILANTFKVLQRIW